MSVFRFKKNILIIYMYICITYTIYYIQYV